MTENTQKPRSRPYGLLILLAAAAALDVAMLVNVASPRRGGEAGMSQDGETISLAFFIWLALALALILGATRGAMPRWAAIASCFVHPIAGVALFVALDAASRQAGGGLIVSALLPLAIGGYALAARVGALTNGPYAGGLNGVLFGAILFLTVVGLMTGLA
jgi:hypothetical protein